MMPSAAIGPALALSGLVLDAVGAFILLRFEWKELLVSPAPL